ncbi:hypothetical protein IFM89_038172 [Coptis chinensis]|uniref:Uncharacterized protein n=1 Tax=Coptis chinensis TaxID=261450 RepID=A0A835HS64_9MAGN|nr:hypothetical protein IFM89_038172 [Coptis chinensis]
MNGQFCSSRPLRIGVATPRKATGHQQQYSSQDGTGLQNAFNTSQDVFTRLHHDSNTGITRVSASTIAWFTLAMAAPTGLGALPFFFVELDP